MHAETAPAPSPIDSTRPAKSEAPRRGPWVRLLTELLTLAGPGAQLLSHIERPWTSATFCGTQHKVILLFDGLDAFQGGEKFVSALPDHEFVIAGQLVADAAISSVEQVQTPPRMIVEGELLLLESV